VRADRAWALEPGKGAGVLIGQPDTGVASHGELEAGALDMAAAWNVLNNTADPTDPRAGLSARDLSARSPIPGFGADGGRTAVLELRYAKGWMYFDNPHGGEQRRYNLREGRRRLRIGQLIQIGRANDFRGGHESNTISLGGVQATQVLFEGWILARVNPYLAEPE